MGKAGTTPKKSGGSTPSSGPNFPCEIQDKSYCSIAKQNDQGCTVKGGEMGACIIKAVGVDNSDAITIFYEVAGNDDLAVDLRSANPSTSILFVIQNPSGLKNGLREFSYYQGSHRSELLFNKLKMNSCVLDIGKESTLNEMDCSEVTMNRNQAGGNIVIDSLVSGKITFSKAENEPMDLFHVADSEILVSPMILSKIPYVPVSEAKPSLLSFDRTRIHGSGPLITEASAEKRVNVTFGATVYAGTAQGLQIIADKSLKDYVTVTCQGNNNENIAAGVDWSPWGGEVPCSCTGTCDGSGDGDSAGSDTKTETERQNGGSPPKSVAGASASGTSSSVAVLGVVASVVVVGVAVAALVAAFVPRRGRRASGHGPREAAAYGVSEHLVSARPEMP